jgi:hypothetical protein
MRVMAIQFSLCGEGLTIGYDGGDTVSRHYPHRFEFNDGVIPRGGVRRRRRTIRQR